MLALEGPLYFAEGMRFVSGHALISGNTPFAAGAHDSWLAAVLAVPFAPAIAVLLVAGVAIAVPRVGRGNAAYAAVVGAFPTHAAWIAAFQNPDHLRHLAPLAVLGGIILVLGAAETPRRWGLPAVALLLATELGALGASGTFGSIGPSPPLAAAGAWLATEPAGTAMSRLERR